MSRFVSNPSRPGTLNSWDSASDAGLIAANAAMVSTSQKPTTSRLWPRTQRVDRDSGSFRAAVRDLANRDMAPHSVGATYAVCVRSKRMA
jgi:hypothetical protein